MGAPLGGVFAGWCGAGWPMMGCCHRLIGRSPALVFLGMLLGSGAPSGVLDVVASGHLLSVVSGGTSGCLSTRLLVCCASAMVCSPLVCIWLLWWWFSLYVGGNHGRTGRGSLVLLPAVTGALPLGWQAPWLCKWRHGWDILPSGSVLTQGWGWRVAASSPLACCHH